MELPPDIAIEQRKRRKPHALGINKFPEDVRHQLDEWLKKPETLETVVGLLEVEYGLKSSVSALGSYWQRRRKELQAAQLPSVKVDRLGGGEYKITIAAGSTEPLRLVIDIVPASQ